jgi:hypothetical protein
LKSTRFCDFIYHHIYREIKHEDAHSPCIREKSLPVRAYQKADLFFVKGQNAELLNHTNKKR